MSCVLVDAACAQGWCRILDVENVCRAQRQHEPVLALVSHLARSSPASEAESNGMKRNARRQHTPEAMQRRHVVVLFEVLELTQQ